MGVMLHSVIELSDFTYLSVDHTHNCHLEALESAINAGGL